jgi:pyridoxamine 5'-phosphate oxidase
MAVAYDLSTVSQFPLQQLAAWLDEARAAGVAQPDAMTLATASADGAPSARMVLLRGLDDRGAVFYTNAESRKGRELLENPRAALVFHWDPLGRQVRLEGSVERVDDEESDAYFASRPLPSRLGAWASDQSRPIESREALMERYAETAARFGDGPVPRPPYWNGFRVVPDAVEFWEHGAHRLHDRIRYTRAGASWIAERLAP